MEKIVFLVLLICLIVFMFLSNKKEPNNPVEILTVANAYEICGTEDNTFSVELYLPNKTDILKYPSKNIVCLKDKENTNLITLEYDSCDVNTVKKGFDDNYYYLYTLVLKANGTTNMNRYFKRAYLSISNNIYKTDVYIGEIYIKNDSLEKLNIDKLYPIYNTYMGFKTMVGIVIKFSPEYSGKTLENFCISKNFKSGGFVELPEEIAPSTPITTYLPNYTILDNHNNFEPIVIGYDEILIGIKYTDLLLLNNTFLDVKIDGISYTLMSMTYHNTNTDLNVYKSIININEVDLI